jgi:PHD/YefM family antitoxin component YafN of YafNO toxin-antitoxin module
MTQLTISEARKGFLDLPEKLARDPEHALCVTRRGRPELAVMPWDLYESIIETLDILSEPELVTALRESIEELENGDLLTQDEVRARIGL